MSNPLVDHFHGQGPLWKVFWLYGVIPSNLLWGLALLMLGAGATAFATSLMLMVILLYTAWIVTAVWRCADNVEDPRYGVMARWLTVAWAINTVLLVGFLQIDVLAA